MYVTHRNAWVETLQVICAANHENSIVVLQAVNLVQEVAPDAVRHKGVKILENQIARGKLASLGKDLTDRILRSSILERVRCLSSACITRET